MPVPMRNSNRRRLWIVIGAIAFSQLSMAQEPGVLLRLQRSRANLDIQLNSVHAQGLYGITYGNPGNVWSYPNSASCLVVYSDGKYSFEKRDEQTLGRPKVKATQGTLSAEDLQRLKSILDNDDLKKVAMPKVPELPADTQAMREAESFDVQIDRSGTMQRVVTIKERVKTGALVSATSGPSSGLDVFLDNGGPSKKALTPLMKWFEGMEKSNKSGFKEAKPQYCAPMNIG